MFHKASSIPLQLGSIIRHNTHTVQCMDAQTCSSWVESPGSESHLVYYHSHCLVQSLATVCLLSFVICFILRSVEINEYWTVSVSRIPQQRRSETLLKKKTNGATFSVILELQFFLILFNGIYTTVCWFRTKNLTGDHLFIFAFFYQT